MASPLLWAAPGLFAGSRVFDVPVWRVTLWNFVRQALLFRFLADCATRGAKETPELSMVVDAAAQ
jgi:hypothetical protein